MMQEQQSFLPDNRSESAAAVPAPLVVQSPFFAGDWKTQLDSIDWEEVQCGSRTAKMEVGFRGASPYEVSMTIPNQD